MCRHSSKRAAKFAQLPYAQLDGFAPPALRNLTLQFPVLGEASQIQLDQILSAFSSLSVSAQQRIGENWNVTDIGQLSALLNHLAVEDYKHYHLQQQ